MKSNKENKIAKFKQTTSSKDLIKFIKIALQENGGDYERILKRMNIVYNFIQAAKECNVDCNFSKIEEAWNDFFIGGDKIKKAKFAEGFFNSMYEKLGDEKRRIWSKRGVSIMQHEETKRPVMYFGQRKAWAEFHKKDTALFFCDDGIMFHDTYLANFDEIPLWGSGTHAEFDFDELDRLTRVSFKKMTEPRLGFWGKETVINFDCGYFLEQENYKENYLQESSLIDGREE